MSKKKSKKKSFKLSPAKLFILIALVALVVIGCFSLVSYLTRDKYYECTQYDYVTKTPVNGGMTDLVEDLLEDHEYYKFILNEDGKSVTLKYKLDEKDSKEVVKSGTYEIVENEDGSKELQIEYKNYDDTEPSVVKYTMNGKKLTRSQFVYVTDSLRGTVKQTFVLN